MSYQVTIETVTPRILAAVHRRVPRGQVSREFKPALDKVWAFLRQNPGLRVDGHNVFLYHHEASAIRPVDFGVEVTRAFDGAGDVRCVTTPAGEAARLVHRGPYDGLGDAHAALHAWCDSNGRSIGRHSLEIYGDWSDDPAKLETTIQYLLL
jgi:effector-binding domain-containing protein